DGLPLKMPVALVDVLAAHHLKEGILLAMIKRQISGKGELVEVSLIQAAISSLTNQATNWLVANNLPKRQGSAHPNIAPYGDNYLTQDKKRVLLAIGSDQQFRNLCKVLNLNEIDSNPLFTSNSQRVNNRDELNLELQEGISKIQASDLISRCNHLKIPAGIIQNLAEVFEMTEAREILINGPEFMGVRNIIGLNGHKRPDISHILPPPKFGEHSHSILNQDLGFSAEKVALLSQNRVIN
ncbi:MAG: CoA transferase, partial [Cyclobacteriaceae bacterium]